MSIPDPNLERSGAHPENVQDIIPPTERSQDIAITQAMHGLSSDASRPLTEDERKAADRDAPVGERVYAPASERVPVEPMPGHREFTEHTDTHTREREAAGTGSGQPATGGGEPSFTRVTRPSATQPGDAFTPAAYGSTPQKPFGTPEDSAWNGGGMSGGLPFGLLGLMVLGIAAGVGGWLYVRWQRERNKPINRIRRQAKQAAGEIRDRVPSSPEEAIKPAAGLTTALLSILILLWQQARAGSLESAQTVVEHGKKAAKRGDDAITRAAEAVSELDWQKRLTTLKRRWNPGRLELGKISISRH